MKTEEGPGGSFGNMLYPSLFSGHTLSNTDALARQRKESMLDKTNPIFMYQDITELVFGGGVSVLH